MTIDVPNPTPVAEPVERRALALWPRLDRAELRRCNDDPACIASVIERRTAIPSETIRSMLVIALVTDDEATTWFG